jgi:hypothetical protein
MALTVFSRTQHHPAAAIEASMKYQRLLRISQKEILTLDEWSVDDCLLAIFFMARYEDAIYSPNHLNSGAPMPKTLRSFAHHDGALSVLKIWKQSFACRQQATSVIKHSRRGIIRSHLVRNVPLPEWVKDGASFGEHGSELEHDRIVVRIANIRHQVSMLLKEAANPRSILRNVASRAEELNEEAHDIDRTMEIWASTFPRTWYHQIHTLIMDRSSSTEDFYTSTVHSYANPIDGALWAQYYTMRMLINSTRLRVLEMIHSKLNDSVLKQQWECTSRLRSMANNLASSIPFLLQRFKVENHLCSDQTLVTLNTKEEVRPYMANLVIWPLNVAASINDLDAKQKEWFRSKLSQLGRLVGYGNIESAKSDQMFQL